MPNISDQITREHILQAVEKIEDEGLEGTSQKYEVMINGKAYPPPLVCQYADYFAKGQTNLIQKNTFPVGTDTRCFRKFEEAGFKIIQKESCQMNSAYEIVSEFLEDAETGNLKTKHYPTAFNNLTMKVSFGQGTLAKVPWIAFLKDGQEVQKGIYPVYIYYKEFNCLILAYGVSQNNPPEHHQFKRGSSVI